MGHFVRGGQGLCDGLRRLDAYSPVTLKKNVWASRSRLAPGSEPTYTRSVAIPNCHSPLSRPGWARAGAAGVRDVRGPESDVPALRLFHNIEGQRTKHT